MMPAGGEAITDSKIGAGVAGAGGGTFLAFVASSLDPPLKDIFLYAAPTVSIILSVAWVWTQLKIGNYFRNKELQSLLNEAKKTLQQALENPNTSDNHKKAIREKMEKLELISVDRIMERVSLLKIITAQDVQEFQSSGQVETHTTK